MQKTTATRLRQEFKTGDHYAVIAERLTGEGLGTSRLKTWNHENIAYHFSKMGLRRKRRHGEAAKRNEKRVTKRAGAVTKVGGAKGSKRLSAVVKILNCEDMSATDRIAVALMLAEA